MRLYSDTCVHRSMLCASDVNVVNVFLIGLDSVTLVQ